MNDIFLERIDIYEDAYINNKFYHAFRTRYPYRRIAEENLQKPSRSVISQFFLE